MNLHQKLNVIGQEIPYMQKANKGHQYSYVSSAQVLSAIKPKMYEMGVSLEPRVTGSNIIQYSTAKGGNRFLTCLIMEFTWVDDANPEDKIVCPWYGQGADDGEKGVGKAMTYAEKYFLLKYFNVPTDKDDPDAFQRKVDNAAKNKATPPASPPARQQPQTQKPASSPPPQQNAAPPAQQQAGASNPGGTPSKLLVNQIMIAAKAAGQDPSEAGQSARDMTIDEAEGELARLKGMA